MKIRRQVKAVSIQSILVGSVVAGVLASAGIATMWGSVDKTKTTVMQSYINGLNLSLGEVKNTIKDTDGDQDYIDELRNQGLIEKDPKSVLSKPDQATYEIHKITRNGKVMFVLIMDSPVEEDKELMNSSIVQSSFPNTFIAE